MLDNPEIIKTIITTSGTILSTGIAALTANLVGKKFLNQEKLKDDLITAMNDIDYLLAVEKEHCERNKVYHDKSYKNIVRKDVAQITDFSWSGKFTNASNWRRRQELK